MREYIVNLTNQLIGKHGFDLMFDSIKSSAAQKGWDESSWKEHFETIVRTTISSRDIREMSHETLGKVMCAIEEHDIPCINLEFYGKPEQFLRNSISLLLAYVIRYRIEAGRGQEQRLIPAYRR